MSAKDMHWDMQSSAGRAAAFWQAATVAYGEVPRGRARLPNYCHQGDAVLDCGDIILDSREPRCSICRPAGCNFQFQPSARAQFMRSHEASLTPVRFSSSDLPERQRVPAWRDFWGRSLFGADIEPIRDAPFHVEVTARFLPHVGLISAACSPSRFSCVPAAVTDDSGSIGLVVGSEDVVARLGGREVEVKAGCAVAMSTSDAATMSWHSSPSFRCILLSRAALAPLVPDLDAAVMRPLPQRSEALRYLLGFARFVEEDEKALSLPIAQSASLHLRDLLALTLGPGKDEAVAIEARSLRAVRLEAIKRFVARNSDDCRLTVHTVAYRFHVTPRSVQRLFEIDGTTFSKYLLDRRLARACEMLAEPQREGSSICEIALQAGFGDISYFNRCFRRRFGGSPSRLRGRPQ